MPVDSAYYNYFRSYTYATLKATLTRKWQPMPISEWRR